MKKTVFICAALSICAAVALSSCKQGSEASPAAAVSQSPAASESASDNGRYTANDKFIESGYEQFKPPEDGEEIAVISTSLGDIKVRLFPQYAPNAVENFMGHAKDSYYNDGIFHRVIKDFMIQGGDPLKNGMGGESIWGTGFEVEINPNLHHIRGALCMARSNAPSSQGSQFYIVHTPDIKKFDTSGQLVEELEYLLANQDLNLAKEGQNPVYAKDLVPAAFIQSYLENGGAYSLDFEYTVFGQVFEGIEIVDAIANVKTGENDKPVEDVVIKGVTIEKYTK